MAFQALWIEIHSSKKNDINFCSIIYRQHIYPQHFLEYFTETLEQFVTWNKSVSIMVDFTIKSLRAMFMVVYSVYEVVHLPQPFASQREFIVTATLIDNILTNKIGVVTTRSNILSNTCDYYSHFCFLFFCFQNPALETDCA